MAIKIKLDGFDKLLDKISASSELAERASESAIRQAANIMQSELKSEMASTMKGGARLASRMPEPEIKIQGNIYSAKVGYKSTPYTPNNLSDYHKAVFSNYGTGRIKPKQFVESAKRKARPKIKKAQKEVLEKVVQRMK